jgi:hypothetical protein
MFQCLKPEYVLCHKQIHVYVEGMAKRRVGGMRSSRELIFIIRKYKTIIQNIGDENPKESFYTHELSMLVRK